jgi:hypothetical protein
MKRVYIWTALGTILSLFFVFKYFYPYPNMVMDSYVYIKGAVRNLDANSFPIGYSKFLLFFSFFSRSTLLLVLLQYLLLEFALLGLFLSVLYFFKPSKKVGYILFAFLFCNPLFLFLSNFIMSDTLFTALSLFWLLNLIWIVCRPQPYMIWTQAVLLLLVFTVRYNALYYPLIGSIAILLSRLRTGYKIAGILLQFVLIGSFVLYTSCKMEQLTGVKQFSPFGGWQMANNALYMYGHIYQGEDEPVPPKFRSLDSTVRHYFRVTRSVESLINDEIGGGGAYYVANNNSPLVRFMNSEYGEDTIFQNFKKWGPMGFTCGQYGAYLLKRHPFEFARYWIWPNSRRYIYPPAEVFQMYTPYFLRNDEFGKMATQLFDIKTLTVAWPLINLRTSLLSWYPLFFALLNSFFIITLFGFCVFGGLKTKDRANSYVLFTVALLWICNAGFSIIASSIVLRYQIFIMIVQVAFGLVLADFVYHDKARTKSLK